MLSLSGKKWIFPSVEEQEIRKIQQKIPISDILAKILAARGLCVQDVPFFLNPKLQDLLPEPFLFVDLEKAVHRVLQAIRNQEHITIYGDYDVDGATSVALFIHYFRALSIPVDFYIPERLTEGYGVHEKALEILYKKGSSLILMVDCGTTSVEEIKKAKLWGLEALIFDHHSTGAALPEAIAVVNPHRSDQPFVPHIKSLCAAGVVFIFLVALQRALRHHNLFTGKLPSLMDFCDLVALGTVCDVMPLQGLNRAFVKRGLEIFPKQKNLGLQALLQVAGITTPLGAYHLGFVLGPRINAGGRIGASSLGTQLLVTEDSVKAKEIAEELHQLNKRRQEWEQKTIDEAIEYVEKNKLYTKSVLLVGAPNWHPGLVGLVASRLKDRYQRPCFVASITDGLCKGSARSVPGIDLGQLIHEAFEENIIESGGGHSMACGFSVRLLLWERFYAFLEKKTSDFMAKFHPQLVIEGELSLSGATLLLLEELERLEPFGEGNPVPRFCFPRVRPCFTRIAAEKHVQCQLEDDSGATLPAIAFSQAHTLLGETLLKKNYMSVVGSVKKNEWNQKPQIIIEDAKV